MAKLSISCMDCERSVYCRSWGEFKCLVKERRIYEPENDARKCKDYKKANKKKTGEDDPKCQCKFCLERGAEEDD